MEASKAASNAASTASTAFASLLRKDGPGYEPVYEPMVDMATNVWSSVVSHPSMLRTVSQYASYHRELIVIRFQG